MNSNEYHYFKNKVISFGFESEIEMVNGMLDNPCNNSDDFLTEYIWVVINSGMKFQIAEVIFYKILYGLKKKYKLENLFGHKQKVEAIKYVVQRKDVFFQNYCSNDNKIEFLDSLPFIGPATKYHFARNLGLDVCKPDRHLLRIANSYNHTPVTLCEKISKETNDRIGVIDVVLWRAGNLQLY